MNKKLRIFVKESNYRLGTEYIILLCLLAIVFLCYFTNYIASKKNEFIEAIGVLTIIPTFLYIVILMISNFFRYERLNGKLSGELKFEEDKVYFGKTHYNINDVTKIEINNWDIKGNFVNSLREFKPHKSNGVKNYVSLHLKNGDVKSCYFLQTQSEKIQIYNKIFKEYYNKNLIGTQNFKNITEEN
jgi:hypothetical protein